MKKILLLLFISSVAFAQSNITKVEYFIDVDPGVDNATNVPITAGQAVTANFNFPVTSLSDGFHLLSIRAKNADNNWSATTYRPFVKFNLSVGSGSTPADIVAMEYFVDTDPGVGNGTAIPITAGQSVENVTFNFPVTSLTDGFHLLSIRAKNADNNWSATTYRPFVKFNLSGGSGSMPADIVAMEYFVDADPGVGNGTAIPITAGQSVDNAMFNVDVIGLSNGIHLLSVRAKNANNQWSSTTVDAFTKKDNIVSIGSVPAAFCRETAFDVPFVVSGTFGVNNVFTLQLSNASGDFTSPTVLGTFTGNTSGTINASIPAGITVAPGYRLRIVASDPTDDEQPIKVFEVLAICPPPCTTSLTLQSTADDYSSGIVLKEVSNTTGIMEAANKITGNAKVTYIAGRSVILKPGFTAANGTVFLVEMGGCSN
ncbi:3-coathanger stack domain-containing protein [Lacihabitans lacunae]|uniref:3-coathanger stack domain-containing protein n=1 Tax=Lacihabitans lacunae TaxID=1028214 RepID=A0ABV7YZ13_9BACT